MSGESHHDTCQVAPSSGTVTDLNEYIKLEIYSIFGDVSDPRTFVGSIFLDIYVQNVLFHRKFDFEFLPRFNSGYCSESLDPL